MTTYEIETLPKIQFAHSYHAFDYNNDFISRESCMEIALISEGSLTISYDGETYTAGPGDLLCTPYHRQPVSIRAEGYHEHHTVMASFRWRKKNDMTDLYLPGHINAQSGTKNAAAIIDQLIHKRLLLKESPTKAASLFLDLLCEIDSCARKTAKPNLSGEMLYVRRAKEYVQTNIRLPITEKGTAEYLGITPEYLCSVFRKSEGISFIRYVNREKLEAVRILIEKEHAKLYEAAALLGYHDPNYVSRLYKKYYGYNITEKMNQFSGDTQPGSAND